MLENALLTLGSVTPRLAKDLSRLSHVAVSCIVRLLWTLVSSSTSAVGNDALIAVQQTTVGTLEPPAKLTLTFPAALELAALSPVAQQVWSWLRVPSCFASTTGRHCYRFTVHRWDL